MSSSSPTCSAAVASLCGFAAQVRFTDLQADARERMGWIVADTIGAIAAGSAEPQMRALSAPWLQPDGATVIGQGGGASPDNAALLNGSAGTFLEMDEGNRFARGHPAIHVLPAALASCEVKGLGAAQFLDAMLAGYELCSRIGAASRLHGALHAHGTWGTLGAAAACGRAAGVDAAGMTELVGIASSLMTATSKKTMLEGGLVRNVYAGLAGRNGMLALQLHTAGFSAERDGVQTLFTEIVSSALDHDTLVRGLGSEWHIMQGYFKLHSCCRYNHGTLDAIDQLAQAGQLPAPDAVDSIDRIVVESYDLAAELNDTMPRNTLAAKFSVPFAVATRLVTGSSGVESFSVAALQNPATLALAARVELHEDKAMTARLPQERPARVTIALRNGREMSAQVGANRGDDTMPYSSTELTQKFMQLTGRIWPTAHCENLLNGCLAITGEGASLTGLCALLRLAPTARSMP